MNEGVRLHCLSHLGLMKQHPTVTYTNHHIIEKCISYEENKVFCIWPQLTLTHQNCSPQTFSLNFGHSSQNLNCLTTKHFFILGERRTTKPNMSVCQCLLLFFCEEPMRTCLSWLTHLFALCSQCSLPEWNNPE